MGINQPHVLFSHSSTNQLESSLVNQRHSRVHNSNVHHHISQRLKKKESKYLGNDEEHLQDYIEAYFTAAEDYVLSAS